MTAPYPADPPSDRVTDAACTLYRADYPTLGIAEQRAIRDQAMKWLGAWRKALGYYPSPFGLGLDFSAPDWHAIDAACNTRYSGFRELGELRAKPIKADAVKWLAAWRKASYGETYVVRFDYGAAGGAPSQKWARGV